MVQIFRNYLKLEMMSRIKGLSLGVCLLLGLMSTGVGGDSSASYDEDRSNLNGDSSLCRVVRASKKILLQSLSDNYTATDTRCDLSNHCSNVTCFAEFPRSKVNAGLVLELCQEDPTLQYWVDIPGQWDQQWVHTFSSKNANGQSLRAEITGNRNDKSTQAKPTKWFIKVIFSITNGRLSQNHLSKYIDITSLLQICQNTEEDSCTNTTLLNFPRLPQNQLCDFTESLSASGDSGGENDGSFPSSSRSSRNANAWDPQLLHRQASEKVSKYENDSALPPSPGDDCNTNDPFGCGSGAACVLESETLGSGKCHCLPGFAVNKTAHVCTKQPHSHHTTDDPSTADSLNSRSYSSALGAIISIILLVGIAAGIFFGTKYHVYERFRHRIPVLRCWPFRRSQPWEDNVTMVNPLGPMDDDDPLLL